MSSFHGPSNYTMVENWLSGPQETQFYTRTYRPSSSPVRALIVFVHGFQEHIGRYAHIHPLIAERGIAVFTFDQRGFGRTALDKDKRSKKSSWGKTGWSDQMQDIDWAIRTAQKEFSGVPVFLTGHSMGGGEVLSFVVQQSYPSAQHAETVASLTGVIVTSPLIRQTTPASKILRWLGGKVATISPYTLIPAAIDVDDLSHSPELNEAYAQDPLIKTTGSLRGIGDMLTEGEKLLSDGCHHWPKKLPILFVHGDADKVTSIKATQEFHEKIVAEDKKILVYPNGYHELQNELPPVRRKLVADIATFIEARTPTPTPAEKPIQLTQSASAMEPSSSDDINGNTSTVPSLTSASSAPSDPSTSLEIPTSDAQGEGGDKKAQSRL
ncbi:hypothetical protein GYMLUDRAFT_43302 [Collybiopsis luxurians FD-317 M1]|uniref:Unplaced genomic scaffold GYMLUscaffold_24, whole genome shotgun sequence n=1 Tax=Collybiopsis luxurians FD-317 M1 TaxID=944289 RepID=A0A0D0CF83_9AGAR|nr:hypothetical protein GYMLUDRAFT_43302 [Collybiopsis luxurians FD-317 M1]